jgi:hypothetical protein
LQTNLGLNPYQKVVYDRNLQALVDKIFPHYAIEDKKLEAKLNGDEYGSTLNYPDVNEPSSASYSNKRQKVDKAKLLEGDGLTLRVVPHNTSSNDSSTSDTASPSGSSGSKSGSQLPQLAKPLLRVCSKTVAIDKIQRFIYKRLNFPPEFNAKDIEILRDGILLDSTKPVAQYPDCPSDAVIVLTYRRITATAADA